MSWTPANSIGPCAERPHRMRGRATNGICESRPGQEHRQSTALSRSQPQGCSLVGKGSPRFSHPFSCQPTPLSSCLNASVPRLRAHRGEATADFCSQKWANSAQFWCNVSPLDATLVNPLVCVANKELAQITKSFRCNIYKKQTGWGASFVLAPFQPSVAGYRPLAEAAFLT